MCKVHTDIQQASIICELIETNTYSAQLTCSLILNSDWSEKVHLSKFLPNNSIAGEWSKSGQNT